MNIEQLLKTGNVTLAISAADLKEFGLALIAEAAAAKDQGESEEIMMSADEVCKVLCVSPNSLWRWGKSGYLKGSKVGRKVFYLKSDVDALLKGKGA